MSYPGFPHLPLIEPERLERCRTSGDFRSVLFDWYRYSGQIALALACIHPDSPEVRDIPAVRFSTFVGLLNRCSRLILANMRLASTGRYGETTRLIDRCIAESAIKALWLMDDPKGERLRVYMADSVRAEFALRDEIARNVTARGGVTQKIEARMLQSATRTIASTGLDEATLQSTKRLPDMRSLMFQVGLDARAYLAVQRMGSHSIHGTWTDLVQCYLIEEPETGYFLPRDLEIATHHNQFVMISLLVFDASRNFVKSVLHDSTDSQEILALIDAAFSAVSGIESEDSALDFEPA